MWPIKSIIQVELGGKQEALNEIKKDEWKSYLELQACHKRQLKPGPPWLVQWGRRSRRPCPPPRKAGRRMMVVLGQVPCLFESSGFGLLLLVLVAVILDWPSGDLVLLFLACVTLFVLARISATT